MTAPVDMPQAGIFALGTASHAYLEFDLRSEADPRALVAGLAYTAPQTGAYYFVPSLPALHAFATEPDPSGEH